MFNPLARRLRKNRISHFRPTAPVSLPSDDSAHYWAQIEWWYYSGHLTDDSRRVYGFELTFFKRITHEDKLPVLGVPAHWLRNVGMVSHFAITDLQRREFFYKRIHNLFRGWKADPNRFHVAIDGWCAFREKEDHRLKAAMKGYDIDLRLTPAKDPALHGERGVVEKGDGQANYHYSYTNLGVRGALTVDGRSLAVTGKSWMDHEYGTIRIGRTVRGWDWFGIQLDDNSELMLYLIRNARNAVFRSYGTCVATDGRVRSLCHGDIQVEPKSFWYSEKTESNYPVSWDVLVKPLNMRLRVSSLLDNQEVATRLIPYWEGIVSVEGSRGDRPVAGLGYAELVGYSDKRSFKEYRRWVLKE
jgi:predicted secreted hydrolase